MYQQWREGNKDILKQTPKECCKLQLACECGLAFSKCCLSKHFQSNTHQDFTNNGQDNQSHALSVSWSHIYIYRHMIRCPPNHVWLYYDNRIDMARNSLMEFHWWMLMV